MSAFNIVAISIFILYFIAFLSTLATIILEKKYKKKIECVNVNSYKNIVVLLPALKEQKIVKSTVDWFRKFKYDGVIKFVIITTEKEEKEFKENKIAEDTTNTVVDNYLNSISDARFLHLHYPETNGNKSSQMNFAVEEIVKSNKFDIANTYISVFDFDSKPELNTFDNLNKVAQLKNNPDVINQVPLSFKNYEKFSKDNKKILMLLFTMYYTVRSCGIEKMRLLISSLTKFNPIQYCMGACMHIKLSTLLENDKFPIFVDDITLGYRLSISGVKFAYLPSCNYTLIPNRLYDYMNSAVLIFKGISTYLSEIKRAKGHLINKCRLFIIGTCNILTFIFIPIYIVVFYLYSIINFQFNVEFWCMLSIPYLWCIASYINIKYAGFNNDKKFNSFLAFLVSPIWFTFRPFGFYIYLKRKIIGLFSKKSIKYKKTER